MASIDKSSRRCCGRRAGIYLRCAAASDWSRSPRRAVGPPNKSLVGACTVLIDDTATRSCITTIDSVGTAAITTIEAIGTTPSGKKIQNAWLDLEVVQCGYCQSGQIMSASALLASKPNPSDSDIDDAMAGIICRCGTYVRIREAIKMAAQPTGTNEQRG